MTGVQTCALPISREGQERFNALLADFTAEGIRPDLIIFDNLSTLTTIDENDNSAQTVITAWLMGLRHQQYAVGLVHHTGKSGDQRGASRRKDNLDYTISLTSAGTEGAGIRTEFVKWRCSRKPIDNAWELRDLPNGTAIWQQVKPPIKKWELALLTIATQHPTTLAALGKGMDETKSTAQKAVEILREKGLLAQPPSLALNSRGQAAVKRVQEQVDSLNGGGE